ncbi:sugar ABC transporter substrate-binding protein [Paenibacillus daejeonensis]|uniref:sugar ABC transporter substrate-binding protein n=1 Tax=Paenibacillus daejeonensis TaxID=135193 RepID=UPI000372DB1C|nr:sugar ABC transporter substrate-binding protein [Paenibacillus daejeonensis]
MMRNTRTTRKTSGFFVLTAILLLSLLVSACGGGSGNSTSAGTSEASASGGSSSGSSIKIGVSIPAEANNSLQYWYKGIQKQAEIYGMEVVGIDAQLNPSKQVSDMDNLLVQGVDVILVWPLDPAAIKPAIDRATEKKVPVIGIDFNTQEGGSDFGLAQQIILGRGPSGADVAELFSEMLPEGSEIGGIGMAAPVPGNIYMMEQYRTAADNFDNITWVGQQNNPTDNIAGAEPMMANLLTKNPNIRAVFAYNDDSAIGAAQAITNNGKSLYSADNPDGIIVVGFNAEQAGIEAIKQGKQYATFNINPIKSGSAMVQAAKSIVVDKATDVKKEVMIPSDLITVDTVDSFQSWDEELNTLQ